MRDDLARNHSMRSKKGVTLIELLVALVVCGIVIAGIYRVFISQTKAYTIQDEIVGIQQDVRGGMEIMVRDIRMAGFQSRSFNSAAISDSPIVTPLGSDSITVNYQNVTTDTLQTVTYALAAGSLTRTLNGVQETLLNNVTDLEFTYGIDANEDKIIDGIDGETGLTPNGAFADAASVGTAKVFAVRVVLTANTSSPDPAVASVISPRTLTSVVIPRNMYFKRYQTY